MTRKRNSLFTAAVMTAATAPVYAAVDGTVDAGEYTSVLATQNTGSQFGDNDNELNAAYASYSTSGRLSLALTGNLQRSSSNPNRLVLFIDSRAGGAIAGTAPGGFGRIGSIGGQASDDWGIDQDGNFSTTTPPSLGSVLGPGFNPDFAIEINAYAPDTAPTATYYTNIIDLRLPNEPSNNRDIYLGENLVGNPAVTQTYTRWSEPFGGTQVPSGTITHAFNNTNTAGVGPHGGDPLGDPLSAATGFEFLFDADFLGLEAGHAVKILPFITSGGGDFLSNQFLPGLGGAGNLGGPGGDGGDPLFDARFFNNGEAFLTVAAPTWSRPDSGSWQSDGAGGNWNDAPAPNGVEHVAVFGDVITAPATVTTGENVTVGSLRFDSPHGYTLNGADGVTLNGGLGAAYVKVDRGSHAIDNALQVASDTRINTAAGANLLLAALNNIAGKSVTKTGDGTLTISGLHVNGPGASLAVDAGTVNISPSAGGADTSGNLSVFAGLEGGDSSAVVNFGATTHLAALQVNPDATVNVTPGGDKTLVTRSLAVSQDGRLNMNDNDLIVDYADGATSPEVAIRDLVKAGRVDQSTTGIFTTPGATRDNVLLAIVDNSDWGQTTYNGIDVDTSTVIGKYTYFGDANLDGKVTGDDYVAVDSNLGTGDSWIEGDFNMDGRVSGDDYVAIDSNLGSGTPDPLAFAELKAEMVALHVDMFGESYLTALAAFEAEMSSVPEPGALSLIGLGALGLLSRRRRRVEFRAGSESARPLSVGLDQSC